jgi:hypothetical protein
VSFSTKLRKMNRSEMEKIRAEEVSLLDCLNLLSITSFIMNPNALTMSPIRRKMTRATSPKGMRRVRGVGEGRNS